MSRLNTISRTQFMALNTIIISLKKLNSERKVWLAFSSVVCLGILFLIFDWNFIQALHLQSYVIIVGFIISITWWYWTMRLIRIILSHREEEFKILQEIVDDIKIIKKDITNLNK